MVTPELKDSLRTALQAWEHTEGRTAFHEFKISGIAPHQLIDFENGDDGALSDEDIERAVDLLEQWHRSS